MSPSDDAVDLLALLNELRVIAENGLEYADDPYDRERYERIEALVDEYCSNGRGNGGSNGRGNGD